MLLSKRRCFWHFISAKWEDLRQYYSDFPWNDYCFYVRDISLCAEHITEVIIPGMELYIPHTFSNTKAKKPWLNSACSHAVNDREALTNGTIVIDLLKLMPYIFQPVIMPNLFSNLLKTLSSIKNDKIFPILTLLMISGI